MTGYSVRRSFANLAGPTRPKNGPLLDQQLRILNARFALQTITDPHLFAEVSALHHSDLPLSVIANTALNQNMNSQNRLIHQYRSKETGKITKEAPVSNAIDFHRNQPTLDDAPGIYCDSPTKKAYSVRVTSF